MSIDNIASRSVLGDESGVISLSNIEDFVLINQSIINQAHHSIRIFTQDFEHALYDRDDIVDAALKLARRHRSTCIEILVIDSSKAVKIGHRLVELAKRLSSSVFIRKVHADYDDNHESFLLVDGIGLVKRANTNAYKGTADFKAIPAAPQKARYFKEVWERSSEDPSLRRLAL
jgi:hypothetical protein